MTVTIGDEAFSQMRERGGDWYAYQNMAMDSAGLGHLKFLKCGEDCTFEAPPYQYPDIPGDALNWKYRLIGKIDLESGQIDGRGYMSKVLTEAAEEQVKTETDEGRRPVSPEPAKTEYHGDLTAEG